MSRRRFEDGREAILTVRRTVKKAENGRPDQPREFDKL